MITIIHGEDIVSSRNYFIGQKTKESITFDAENMDANELELSLQGSGLFGSTQNVFIENLFSRKAKNIDQVVDAINRYGKDFDIYLAAGKPLTKTELAKIKKFDDKNFKIPSNIFGFLDSLRPSSKQNVNGFHNALSTTDEQIIFAMLIRQFRLMLSLIPGSVNKIDDVKRLAPWQKQKLERQMSLFGQEKIKNVYKRLYKIDKEQKTGGSILNLTQNIDILLLEI